VLAGYAGLEGIGSGTGRAQLQDGVARVGIDPDFAAVSGIRDDYHVFLTAEGRSNGLYITDRTSTGFEVREHGERTSRISFGYRIPTDMRYQITGLATPNPYSG
jgi:hypothetical protein